MKKVLILGIISLIVPEVFAQNANITRVLSSADGPNVFDFDLTVEWNYEMQKAEIWREQNSSRLGKVSAMDSRKNELDVAVKFGLYHDLELDLVFPIIIGMKTNLDAVGGRTVIDNDLGLKDNKGKSYPLFTLPVNGPQRSGFGDMKIAFKYGVLSQARDPLYPSWMIGIEYAIPTGTVMKGNNNGVSDGLHKIKLETALSHRIAFFEPYFGAWGLFRVPSGKSLFKNYGETQKNVSPGSRIGMQVGAQFWPWWAEGHKGQEHRYFSLDIGFEATYTFRGREYSPLFEALAVSPDNTATMFERQNPKYNPDKSPAVTYLSDSPLTDVGAYGSYGVKVGFNLQPIEYLNFGFHFMFKHIGDHVLTASDTGKDLNGSNSIEYGTPNDPQAPNEYNPVYNRAISEPGHRFFVKAWNTYTFFVSLTGKY